jgi:crotonobetainyl-CoA:carnitine CoA-transferase CaiB-like acyl-CoA transferase
MLPLAGVRILAVEQYGAGPFGTMYLANQGAEVIKIENPRDGGDMARAVGPHFFGPEDSQFFHSFNLNKKSLTLDLRSPEGQAIFHDLVRGADAVANNLRGDVPEKLGLDYAALKAVNPAIVCAHLSAYGRTGSRRDWPGYDYLMQAEAGWFSVTGEPDTPPTRFGLSVVDMMAGLSMAYALTTALVAARSDGQGRDVDTSLFDLAMHTTTYLSTWCLNADVVQDRLPRSAHPVLTPCQLYKTADGWIYIMCNKEKFWPILAEFLGHPEWGSDPRFASFADRHGNRALIQDLLDEALSTATTDTWLKRFAGQVPAAPINDIGQAMANPFVAERDGIHDFPHPTNPGESFQMVAHPIRDGNSPAPKVAAPALGQDSDAVLSQLGLDETAISALRKKGVI